MNDGARFQPVLPIGGVICGALVGLSGIVLGQQFGVLYPSRGAVIGAMVAGAAVVAVLANVLRYRALARSTATAAPTAATADTPWQPGHRVPADGLDAYDEPDGSREATTRLDAGLAVEVLEHRGDWALVRCSNGWTTWVDSRLLESEASLA